jgi:hypothetical protein
LSIGANDVLTDLCALYNMNLFGDRLFIWENIDLSMATAYALETQLRSNGFTGTSSIHDNDGTGGLVTCETLIALSSFDVTPANGKITLEWSTASEIDNAGFNIYRAEGNGGYVQINTKLIPAEGTPTEGASYEFIDEDVENRQRYWYMLEDVDLNGVSTIHGPVKATPRLIYGILGR